MLKTLALKNFRCFASTEKLHFALINVFIGSNNAGKSSFLSATELMLRSGEAGFGQDTPVQFALHPEYASFSSVLRKGWSRSEQKATEFVIDAEWSGSKTKKSIAWSTMTFNGDPQDDLTYVSKASYGRILNGKTRANPDIEIAAITSGKGTRGSRYKIETPKLNAGVFFLNSFPMFYLQHGETKMAPKLGKQVTAFQEMVFEHLERQSEVFVIRPYRPMPRRLYVLDDPSMSAEDRAVMSYLVKLWQGKDVDSRQRRDRIKEGLRTLKLATHLDITRPVRGATAAFQVRVSTGSKRELVTIADVGFGLSQVLPLLTRDASLTKGILVAYQPEVHLHPYAQSRLADIFSRSAARGNSIFVETHSQHLILRLQYLIANGDLKKDDVKVFCVEKDTKQSIIREMGFTENGKPTTPWPKGFLDTGLNLARELASARIT